MDPLEFASSRLRELLGRRRSRRAPTRATKLLLAHLTPGQRVCLADRGYFVVRGNASGDKYQVYMRAGINVVRVKDGTRFCFFPRLPRGSLPREDIVLGQALILRHCEDWLLQKTGWR